MKLREPASGLSICPAYLSDIGYPFGYNTIKAISAALSLGPDDEHGPDAAGLAKRNAPPDLGAYLMPSPPAATFPAKPLGCRLGEHDEVPPRARLSCRISDFRNPISDFGFRISDFRQTSWLEKIRYSWLKFKSRRQRPAPPPTSHEKFSPAGNLRFPAKVSFKMGEKLRRNAVIR